MALNGVPHPEALKALVRSGPRALFATVSGAHLYGFESPDSDVDVRGSFVLPLRSVLGLDTPKESITICETREGVEVDWVAHDVKKFASLMTKRNGYVLEQLYSPLVVAGGEWLSELRELGKGCIIRPLYYHYRGFFHNQLKVLDRPGASVKDLLYAYRVVLSGVKVLASARVEAHLPTLIEEFSLPQVSELVARKKGGQEKAPLRPPELARHRQLLSGLEDSLTCAYEDSRLPLEPVGVAALSDYVVRARMELG